MRNLTFILTLFVTVSYGQSYNWDYVIRYVRANKMNTTNATRQIVAEISQNFQGEKQQAELIRFYTEAHDFKIVDKVLLKNVVDSLALHGLTGEIRALAISGRESIENRLLHKEIKDFDFPDVHGKPIQLSSLRNKFVVVELWATWCAPCIEEMKNVTSLRSANPDIEFYSISLDKSPDRMKKFVERNKYEWPIVFGGDEQHNPALWDYLHIVAIPKYYIIDKNGIVINVSEKLDQEFVKNLH